MAKKHDVVFHKQKLIDALERSLGIVSAACKEVGISRTMFYEYCKTDPEFKRAVDDIYEIQTDFVENQLLKNIKNGDNAAIIFYLKYKGKKRGYVYSQDIQTTIKTDIVIEPKEDDDIDGIDESF
jgi:hypothetical protein